MNTDKAFSEMIHLRGIHNKLGVSQKLVSAYRQHLKNDRKITVDQKIQLLQKAGYEMISEPKWKKPQLEASEISKSLKDLLGS